MTPDPNGTDQLAALFPEPRILEIAGRKVTVSEMPVRKIAKFSVLLAPVLARYPVGMTFDLPSFFLAAGEAAVEGVAYAVDQPVEWVGELRRAEFEKLVHAVKDANQDFFGAGLGLLVSAAMETMLKATDLWTGQPLSPASSSTATEIPAATH